MERAEKFIIKERGRPALMKIGLLGGENANVKMMSAQFPVGSETIPSSLREMGYAKKTANHVLDVTGVVTDNQISVQLMIDGHSSYTRSLNQINYSEFMLAEKLLKKK